MSNVGWMTRLERIVVARSGPERDLLNLLELGAFVALLAPLRCGRSTLLRGLKAKLEQTRPGALFLLLRPDQSAELPRETFLQDLNSKLRLQMVARGLKLPASGDDPYLELKNTLAELPSLIPGPVVVAVDDLGRVDQRHLRTLLWVFRELYQQRADEGWSGPLNRLAVVVAGSKRLHELTMNGQDDLSPFNVAELYFLPPLTSQEVQALVDRIHQDGLLEVRSREETFAALQEWVGGHPALLKSVLAAVIQGSRLLTPATVAEAARAAIPHDRTLLLLWERLQGDAAALEVARQIFTEGSRPPDNLDIAPEAVQVLYWGGAVVDRNGRFEPCCRMIEEYMRQRFEPARAPEKPEIEVTPPPRFPPAAFPDGLVHGFTQGAGVLFVGAGASRAAGYPTWAELATEMTARILRTARDPQEHANLEAYLKNEGPLAVAQLLRDRLGVFEYHRFLNETLRKPAALAPVHHALRKLPTNLILTTNFDKLLERTWRTPYGDDPPAILSTPQLAMIQEQAGPMVVKMHGDIDHPDSIVLTADDYAGFFERHRALRNFLEHQFAFRTVLFVGFGLRDPNFELVFEETRRILAGRGRPAYSVMVGINPIEAERWRVRGMHIIDLPGYDDIPAWIEALAEKSGRGG